MYRPPAPNDQGILVTQWAKCSPDLEMEVWFVPRVHGDDGCRKWNAVRKHADDDQERVVYPIECGSGLDVETGACEELDHFLASFKVGTYFIGYIP